jgi:hypothetical protein
VYCINANPLPGEDWQWRESNKIEWEVTNDYNLFYQHWRPESSFYKFRKEFPYTLELGADEHGESFIPFRPFDTTKGQILVIKSYEDIFQRILRLREQGLNRGIVLSGQPGTGKSLSRNLHPVRPLTGASIREKHLSEVPASATSLSSPGRTFW